MTINTMQERQLRKERAALSLLAVASASTCAGVRPYQPGPGLPLPARSQTLLAGVIGCEQPARQRGKQMRLECGDISAASSKEERSACPAWGSTAPDLREEKRRFLACGDRLGAHAFPGIAHTTPWGMSRGSVTR